MPKHKRRALNVCTYRRALAVFLSSLVFAFSSLSLAKITRQAHLMGTSFTIIIGDEVAEAIAVKAMDKAFQEVARVESLMSEWIADSEISQINRNAGIGPTKVSAETMSVLSLALEVSELSKGAFDPSWASLKGLWSFQSNNPKLPKRSEIRRRLRAINYQNIILSKSNGTAFLAKPDMSLGLGAIAKGYGIDRAKSVLADSGIKNFIVDGGGDLFASGAKNSGPWMVGIRHPREDRLLIEFPVKDKAIVTSGDYERFFILGSRRYHHILDLKTGLPANLSVSVTVIADRAVFADSIATAVFVLGPIEGLKLVKKMPGVDAIILAPDGRLHHSDPLNLDLPPRWFPI